MSAGPAEESPRPHRTSLVGAAKPVRSYVVADPPADLSGTFGSKAKSPHGLSRTGVVLLDERPPEVRRQVAGRRPVIAVVDTVITAHPWLGSDTDPDPFWRTPDAADGWSRPDLSPAPDDGLETIAPSDRIGPSAKAYGHGTFIAGIVRQLAPEATILSLPVMRDSGHADTNDVLNTLRWLLGRVEYARTADRPDLFVDVVNLSFGWYPDVEGTAFPAESYGKAVRDLGAAGVRIVASAGNRSSTTAVYPAAFAREQSDAKGLETPLVSVGALDPNGKVAAYSNSGDWVRLMAPGTGLISSVPPAADAPLPEPWFDDQGCPIPVPNPNHQARGFARWGGTSFAAAWVSAKIARHLLDDDAVLEDLSVEATHARAATALEATLAEPDVQQTDGLPRESRATS
ncbi:MAG TPA: S8/S53 family peptidase [Microlunatus sp.]